MTVTTIVNMVKRQKFHDVFECLLTVFTTDVTVVFVVIYAIVNTTVTIDVNIVMS